MIQTILSTLAVFIGSSIEEIPIFVLLFSRARSEDKNIFVILGILIGNVLILSLAVLLSRLVGAIPNEKVIGTFGLVPLIIGIAVALGFTDDETSKFNKLNGYFSKAGILISTALITFAMGGDDLAIYVPFFLTLSRGHLILAVVLLLILAYIQCLFCIRIYNFRKIADFLEKYERIIVPLVFIPLGLYIMIIHGVISF